MGKPYSQDLREHVLGAIDDGGNADEIAPLFNVSVSYIYKILARRRATGETTARCQRHVEAGRVEDGRGSLGHAATLRFPSPLIGRVEDWRAGVGRSLCSLLSRPFVCECHSISTMPRFQPPPRRTQRADFLALRSPVCFATRLIRPILPERLSTSVAEPGSR
jgi:Transposase